MIKYFCDRCGTEISKDDVYFVNAIWGKMGEKDEQVTREMDLCGNCLDDIVGYLNYRHITEPSTTIESVEITDNDINIKYTDSETITIPTLDASTQNTPETAPEKTEKAVKTDENAEKGKPGPARKVDYGKVMALYDASWSSKAIAEEVGCTPQTVNNIIRKELAKRIHMGGEE